MIGIHNFMMRSRDLGSELNQNFDGPGIVCRFITAVSCSEFHRLQPVANKQLPAVCYLIDVQSNVLLIQIIRKEHLLDI
jgi:hypothetical protein